MKKGIIVVTALFFLPVTLSGQDAGTNAEAYGCGGQCVLCDPFNAELIEHNKGNHWPYTYSCTTAACPNACVGAGIELPDVDAALAAAEADRVEEVIALVRDRRDAFLVNHERGLLQVLNCSGNVAAQTPLSPRLLAALEGEGSGGILLAMAVPEMF